jgi:hypothetical protein
MGRLRLSYSAHEVWPSGSVIVMRFPVASYSSTVVARTSLVMRTGLPRESYVMVARFSRGSTVAVRFPRVSYSNFQLFRRASVSRVGWLNTASYSTTVVWPRESVRDVILPFASYVNFVTRFSGSTVCVTRFVEKSRTRRV